MSISPFFTGKTILLTGATGMLAKAIAEKLLRDLPGIARLYLLIRPRNARDRSPEAAWKRAESEIFQSSLFDRLRRQHGEGFPDFCQAKVRCLSGDVALANLGLAPAEYALLKEEIDLVINSAATVNFDERLDVALGTNVSGVSHLLELARTAGATLVQVSTAYVSGRRAGDIPETIVEAAFNIDAEIALLRDRIERAKEMHPAPEALKRELIRLGMERARERGWFDTYTFTKFLGEQWLKHHQGEVPAVIVRPSIIESSLRDPEPGWITGLRMIDPIIIAAGRGLARFPMQVDVVIDLIPLDFVVNATLATALQADHGTASPKVFAVASSSENPVSQGDLIGYVRAFYERQPLEPGVPLPQWRFPSVAQFRRSLAWRRRLWPLAERWLEKLRFFEPARGWRLAVRRQSIFIEQLWSYLESYAGYLTLRCRFQTGHTRQLHEGLSAADRERFGFDVREIDWRSYIQEIHIPGLIRNVLRQPVPAISSAAGKLAQSSQSRSQRMFRAITSWFARRYLTVECRGLERLPAQGPCILAANHASHLDWLAIREALRPCWPDLYVMGAEDYFFNTRLKAWFFSTFLHVLPFNRREGITRCLGRCREILSGGHSVLLFPEGTRSIDGALQPFKAGIGVLAVELAMPVVPIHVSGTFESLPKGQRFPKPGRVQVRIGMPMNFRSAPDAGPVLSRKGLYRQAVAKLRESLASLAAGDFRPPESFQTTDEVPPEPQNVT